MFPLKAKSGPKASKPKLREAHTQFTKHGMGDYYGTGSKNPLGRMRDASVGFRPVSKKQLGSKPRSVV